MDKDKLTYKAGDKVVYAPIEPIGPSMVAEHHYDISREALAIQKRNGGYLVVVNSAFIDGYEVVILDLGCDFIKKFSISCVLAAALKMFTERDAYCHPDLAVLRALW